MGTPNRSNLPDQPVWMYPRIDPGTARKIVDELHIHPITAQILVSRGLTDLDQIQEFLYAKLPALFDPFMLGDMEIAVQRISKGIEQGENILVYGDNDVDGMTGATLLVELIERIGGTAFFHVPNPNDIGKGMLSEGLERAQSNGCKLMITVDCGITAVEEIKRVVSQGIDVIVTDHHEPTAKLPLCIATLNPKLVDNAYPNRELTGVGVAFKLAHALVTYLARQGRIGKQEIDLKEYLDLVALGTIADMGTLLQENRILVRYGLRQLRRTGRVGLRKLAEVCELSVPDVYAIDVAAKIAPRLNSLGRIADPRKGVELLLARDPNRAEQLAKELDLNNIERQKIEQLMAESVEATFEAHPEILQDKAIVMASDQWHPGVIAIVTTRTARMYNRPTLMIAIDQGVGKGSMRTIREFPLLPVLKENADLLLNFGGHDYAAGLTIAEENIPAFRERFIAKANEVLQDQDVLTKLYIDAHADFDQLTFDLLESLSLLEPHGNENAAPVFYCDTQQVRPPKIVGTHHMKFYCKQGERNLEGIGFGMAHRREQLRGKNLSVRLAYTPQINRYQNKVSIQLIVRDFKLL